MLQSIQFVLFLVLLSSLQNDTCELIRALHAILAAAFRIK
jgi:hypothetical protein